MSNSPFTQPRELLKGRAQEKHINDGMACIRTGSSESDLVGVEVFLDPIKTNGSIEQYRDTKPTPEPNQHRCAPKKISIELDHSTQIYNII